MPYYENVFIARQDISAAQVEALTEAFATIIAENGGEVTKREYWGLKNLAYRIKKNRKGHYALVNIDAPADAVKEMERNMRLNEDVIRFMTVRVDALEEGPSVVMQSRGSRDDRPRRQYGGGGGGGRGPSQDGNAPARGEGSTADAPAKTEPAKTEPAKTEPAKAEPAKTEKATEEAKL